MEPSQIRALIVSRQFLDRAALLGEDGTETGRMGGVVLADLAAELAAKAALVNESLTGRAALRQDPPLPVVLEALTKLWQARQGTEEDVPEIREALRLHGTRNSVQHEGLAPSSDQVVEARLRSQRFLGWVAMEWFGVPLESLSRAQLIRSKAVRETVEAAERVAAEDDYAQAATFLAVAFAFARTAFRAEMREGGYEAPPATAGDVSAALAEVRRGGGVDAQMRYHKLDAVLRSFGHQLERLGDQVEALTLGARASDYAWFKRTFPKVRGQMRDGKLELYTVGCRNSIVMRRQVRIRG